MSFVHYVLLGNLVKERGNSVTALHFDTVRLRTNKRDNLLSYFIKLDFALIKHLHYENSSCG